MEKQVYKAKMVWVKFGISAISAVTAFAIISDDSVVSGQEIKGGRDDVVNFRATWNSVCNQKIPQLIELRRVLGQQQFVILATLNETAEQSKIFAAARETKCAVAIPGSSALPVLFCDVRSRPTTIFTDRVGIIKLVA